jgi:hypothetical protein
MAQPLTITDGENSYQYGTVPRAFRVNKSIQRGDVHQQHKQRDTSRSLPYSKQCTAAYGSKNDLVRPNSEEK